MSVRRLTYHETNPLAVSMPRRRPRAVRLCQTQRRELVRAGLCCSNLLKRIDEYNYCRYTKGWLA